jgi:carbon-monoxide dehydrogenase medium subunit
VKPCAFDYVVARTVDEAVAALADGDDARILAGGQSLVPLMNLRLARPERLVDINEVAELDYVEIDESTVRIGALTRHRQLELDVQIAAAVPLLTQAAALVGHPQIRNRATIGGTFGHADPVAEISAAVLALGGRITIAGPAGRRTVDAGSFFTGSFTSVLRPGEVVVEVDMPVRGPFDGTAFREFAPRHGDFATAGVGAVVSLDDSGRCTQVALAGCALGPTPVDLTETAHALLGERELSDAALEELARRVGEAVDPPSDAHGSAAYRRELAQVLTVDAVRGAWRHALEVSP